MVVFLQPVASVGYLLIQLIVDERTRRKKKEEEEEEGEKRSSTFTCLSLYPHFRCIPVSMPFACFSLSLTNFIPNHLSIRATDGKHRIPIDQKTQSNG